MKFLPIILFLFIFSLWFCFSNFLFSFFNADNSLQLIPLLIEAIRQIKAGAFPLRTSLVGGAGGIPLFDTLIFLIFDPFASFPALFLENHPSLLMNVIVSFHVAIYALGGYLFAASLKASKSICLSVGLSLGLSGYILIFSRIWFIHICSYFFLPWVLFFINSLLLNKKKIFRYQLFLIASIFCMFHAGTTVPVFYCCILILFWCLLLYFCFSQSLKKIFLTFLPTLIASIFFILPIWYRAYIIYNDFFGYTLDFMTYKLLNVPFGAYLGFVFPFQTAQWLWWDHVPHIFSNLVTNIGFFPVIWVLISILRNPSQMRLKEFFPIFLFLLIFSFFILSPSETPLLLQSKIPLINHIRWPIRALPAFHILVIFLFILLLKRDSLKENIAFKLTPLWIMFLSFGLVFNEIVSINKNDHQQNWFKIYKNSDEIKVWDQITLDVLRKSDGYILSLKKNVNPIDFEDSSLYLAGNLGCLYKIRTIHSYLFRSHVPAFGKLDMARLGMVGNWEYAKALLEKSPTIVAAADSQWNNKIFPSSFQEISEKTKVSAVIVEESWTEPTNYFLSSKGWSLLDKKYGVQIFFRKS